MPESFFPNEAEEQPGSETPSPTAPSSASVTPKEELSDELSEEGRMAAILSYIPFLCFIPLVNINWKDNEEARFHARQGIVLFLIELVAIILLIDDLAKFLFKALLVIAAALAVAGVYFSLQGKRFRLPIISDLADKAKL